MENVFIESAVKENWIFKIQNKDIVDSLWHG